MEKTFISPVSFKVFIPNYEDKVAVHVLRSRIGNFSPKSYQLPLVLVVISALNIYESRQPNWCSATSGRSGLGRAFSL